MGKGERERAKAALSLSYPLTVSPTASLAPLLARLLARSHAPPPPSRACVRHSRTMSTDASPGGRGGSGAQASAPACVRGGGGGASGGAFRVITDRHSRSVCVCVCARACVRACVRACMRASKCACVRACVQRACMHACGRACMYACGRAGARVCASKHACGRAGVRARVTVHQQGKTRVHGCRIDFTLGLFCDTLRHQLQVEPRLKQ